MRRHPIYHEGSRSGPRTSGWMLVWRQTEVALALAEGTDDPRAPVLRLIAQAALARTLEGRQN